MPRPPKIRPSSKVEIIPKGQHLVSLRDYAKAIQQHLQKTTRDILEVCRLLTEARLKFRLHKTRPTGGSGNQQQSAKETLEFEAWVERELPFSKATADKMMAIGQQLPKLAKYVPVLPPEWTKLYILSTFPDYEIKQLLKDHPKLTDLSNNDLLKWREYRGTDKRLPPPSQYVSFSRYELRQDTPEHIKARILEDEKKHRQYLQDEYAEWVKIDTKTQTEKEHDLLLKEQIDEEIAKRQKTFMATCKIPTSRVREANDAWRQIRTRKFPIQYADGSFHKSDIRHSDHYFHQFVKGKQTDPNTIEFRESSFMTWCRENGVVCADMNIGKLDEEQRINFLKRDYIQYKLKGKMADAQKVIDQLVKEISQSRFTKTKNFALSALELFAIPFPKDEKKRYVSTIASMNRQSASVPKRASNRKRK